jgi:hypothetical protein
MSDQDTKRLTPQIRAMNRARVRALAEVAARDEEKRRRAINVVVAALDLELLTIDELVTEQERLAS